ncbi:nitrous oxide reductase accessory protein NosL [Nitrosophilus kaiyonis]|uniref:nitrous oxide reductase accessory protein NosL n=1 Tax=Nitrosophilus kaiyonis TaxID=2930200 RepID=UPI00249224E6|nr:nitrous oxide reductase accessory protein NosL [Nitrosophilus kaiyonis]
MKKFLFVIFFSIVYLLADTNSTKILDPVYHIDVNKYPKFQAKIVLANGKEILFCCPKSMFNVYLRPSDYPEYHIKGELDFKKILVKDYLSGEWIKAEGALYVFGSKLQGPKGDDLIPVRNRDALNIFRLKYGGSKVLTFPEIIHKGMGLIKYLDMP